MSSFISIDPGIRNTGVAEFVDNKVVEWYTIETPKRFKGFTALTYQLRKLEGYISAIWTDEVIIEGYYPRSANKSMMHGIMLVGGIVATSMPLVNKIYMYTPAQWKRWANNNKLEYSEGETQHEKDAIMMGRYHITYGGKKSSSTWSY
jgi:Holliday junction resolvasome RuvABC endonuclease subunit